MKPDPIAADQGRATRAVGSGGRSPTTGAPTEIPDHARVDRELGARIKARRLALGHSQTWLGVEVGVSFQQVQKYERGINRVSASALVAIADALCTTSCALLQGLGAHDADGPPAMAWARSADGEAAYLALHALHPDAFAAVLSTARVLEAMRASAASDRAPSGRDGEAGRSAHHENNGGPA